MEEPEELSQTFVISYLYDCMTAGNSSLDETGDSWKSLFTVLSYSGYVLIPKAEAAFTSREKRFPGLISWASGWCYMKDSGMGTSLVQLGELWRWCYRLWGRDWNCSRLWKAEMRDGGWRFQRRSDTFIFLVVAVTEPLWHVEWDCHSSQLAWWVYWLWWLIWWLQDSQIGVAFAKQLKIIIYIFGPYFISVFYKLFAYENQFALQWKADPLGQKPTTCPDRLDNIQKRGTWAAADSCSCRRVRRALACQLRWDRWF